MSFKTILFILTFSFISIFATFCDSAKNNTTNTEIKDSATLKQKNPNQLVFESLKNGKKEFNVGEFPVIKVSMKDSFLFDSIQFFFNKKKLTEIKSLPVEIKLQEKIEKVGKYNLESLLFVHGTFTKQEFPIVFLSDIEPQNFTYEILKIYPHDKLAYTQGLIFDNGFLYEATGLKGESSLRKVQLSTGDPIQSVMIDPKIFGEGITLFNDKIIQLSWQNNTGFIYDKKTFQLMQQFSYPTEGWGLTNDGTNLIMSDGTNKLYFLEPQSYSELYHIEVFDNKGPVDELNELEFIDGQVYANIYRTDKIARIDPKTGKVLAYIDLSKILPASDFESETDVLNGIAYDPAAKRLFVTGKKWPKLFEIKLKQK